jgi:hypothetical protein
MNTGLGDLARFVFMGCGLMVLLGLSACASLKVEDDTPTNVTIRYDGVASTLDDATAAANQACAAHGKVAKLRDTDIRAALERFAYFNCVSG